MNRDPVQHREYMRLYMQRRRADIKANGPVTRLEKARDALEQIVVKVGDRTGPVATEINRIALKGLGREA